jgi:hypothetical protein
VISTSAITQAKREVICPKCKAPVNEDCRTPSGRRCNMHGDRENAYLKKIGFDEYFKRHTHRWDKNRREG